MLHLWWPGCLEALVRMMAVGKTKEPRAGTAVGATGWVRLPRDCDEPRVVEYWTNDLWISGCRNIGFGAHGAG